ncbi:MAG: DinB family protein [Chloroflexi bacterium]|nr:DinB family protein [Chloroflexota bacterium]MCC6895291.1 DinB family protein [Anaerolineae bacterium]
MKTTDTLTTLFTHHRWSNLRLLESCANLTDEQLQATMVGAFSTIIETWRHIATSEQSYFSRISTGKRYDRPADLPPMTLAEVTASLRETGDGLIEWAGKVQPDERVVIDWEGTPRLVPKTILLSQVLNHAGEHREQIKSIMTQIGVEPPDLQAWEYFDQNYEWERP